MARRSYLQRIAQPLRAGDPVLFALPRASSAESRPAVEVPAPRAPAPDKPLPPDRRAAPRTARAPDAAPPNETLGPLDAPAEMIVEAAAPTPPQHTGLSDAPPPPSLIAPAPSAPIPAQRDADPPLATVAHTPHRPTAPRILEAPVSVVHPPSSDGTVAAPRIHIGTVEVRSHTQPPAPVARPPAPAARRADTPPISRGYAWHFGLIQG
jgi:hypothetical protein